MVIPSPWTVASKDQGQYDYWLILANILPMSRTFSVDETLSDGSWIQLMFVESVTRRAQIDRTAQLMAGIGSDRVGYFGGRHTTSKLGRSDFTGD